MPLESYIYRMSSLGIIVLHWNNRHDVERLLSTIRNWELSDAELYLVDNSRDFTWTNDSGFFNWLTPDENLGFAGGCNLGITKALEDGCTSFMLLNADIIISAENIIELRQYLQREHLAVTAPVLKEKKQGNVYFHYGGRHPLKYDQTRIISHQPNGSSIQPDYLPGTVLLIAKAAWEANGPFDEEYFFSGEVADWFLRLHSLDLKYQIHPDVIVEHQQDLNSSYRQENYVYYTLRNRFLFIKKFGDDESISLIKKWTKKLRRQLIGTVFTMDFGRYKTIKRALRDGRAGSFGRSIYYK